MITMKELLKQYEKELKINEKIKKKMLYRKTKFLTDEEVYLICDALFLQKRQLEESIEILKNNIRKD